jgi:sulfopropanediol 3-dehydrogenase
MTRYLKDPNPPTMQATDELRDRVAAMLRDIETGGIDAVRRWSQELDAWNPDSFIATEEDHARAEAQLDDDLKGHIALALEQVRGFAQAQRDSLSEVTVELTPGVTLGHKLIPVQTVGAYVPGGRYPMLASSFMTIAVAKVAGVDTVVGCAPPQREGSVHPAMLYAMRQSGADAVLSLGGVQGLAAMAYGLIEGLPAIDMLVGAGNAYVAEAKRQLFGTVGIDLLAGPTEVLVIADDSADPRLVAADLLGQAEHGPNSPAGLIAIGEDVGRAVMAEVDQLLETWPTADIAGQAWAEHGWVAIAADDDEAIRLSDEAANEHLEVQVAEAKLAMYRERLRNYGSLFLGERATVAYGDKGVGTNHVLPTLGGARYTGGLWVGKFIKTCTWQPLTDEGTRAIAPTIEAICAAERFAGHGLTATMRLERIGAGHHAPDAAAR